MDQAILPDSLACLGKALDRLKEVLAEKNINHNTYLRDATIQRFKWVIELYWKVLKKWLAYEKVESSTPRDVMEKAYQYGIIDDEKIWIMMLEDRNMTPHVYREQDVQKIFEHIQNHYITVLVKTYTSLDAKINQHN